MPIEAVAALDSEDVAAPAGVEHLFGEVTPALAEAIRNIRLIVFDFDGVFTDNTVYVSEEGVESVRCWRSDGLGLRFLERLNVAAMILSTEENVVVTARSRKLKIRCVQGCSDKREKLEQLMAEEGLTPEQVTFVGNDINDLGALGLVGLPIVVADSHPDVIHAGRYRTRTPGGHGAVREVCDLFKYVLEDLPR